MISRKDFINRFNSTILPLSKQYNIFPEIVYSQAFIEGSDGKGQMGESYTMKYGNNIFNVRPGGSWKGEVISNPFVKSESKIFRKYNSLEDSITDYFQFLASNPRYKKAGVFDAKSIADQAEALQRAGYAGSSTTYANILTNLSKGVQKLMGKAVDVEKKVVKNVSENWYWYALGTAVVGGAVAVQQKWIRL